MSALNNRVGGSDHVLDRIVEYSGTLRFEDLPREVVRESKIRLIDTLGALVGGFDGKACNIVRQLAFGMPADQATVIGTSFRTSLEMAAFVNAVAARDAEMMDVYHFPGSFGGHPSDVVMAVLAVAEHMRASGADLITAIVLAYEIFLRFSDMFRNRGFDDTNFASIAVAAAAGRLMRLGEAERRSAVAMAAVANVILRQVRADQITMWKVLAAGYAGRAGTFAAVMARAGLEGPDRPFVGTGGWINHVAGGPLPLVNWGSRETSFKILDTRLKTRPSAGETISSILAAEKLHPLIGPPDAVKSIRVEVYHRALDRAATGAHHWNPESRDAADHSIPYVVAVAIRDGALTVDSFDEAHLHDPEIRRLMSKIEVIEDEAFTRTYPHDHRTRITVTRSDGEQMVAESGGDADDISTPKTDEQVSAKFMAQASARLGQQTAAAILAELWSLEHVSDVASLPGRFEL